MAAECCATLTALRSMIESPVRCLSERTKLEAANTHAAKSLERFVESAGVPTTYSTTEALKPTIPVLPPGALPSGTLISNPVLLWKPVDHQNAIAAKNQWVQLGCILAKGALK